MRWAAPIEEEKRKRIQLAVSLLPRTFRDQSGAILRLQQFAGTVVAIGYLDEQEPLSVGEQVTFVLEHAGWKTYGMPLRNIWPSEGVRVYVRVKAGALVPGSDPASQTKAIAEYMRSERVGSLLVDELNKSGIDAKFSPGPRLPNVPDETLYISVGARPTSTLLDALKGTRAARASYANRNRYTYERKQSVYSSPAAAPVDYWLENNKANQ